MNSQRKIQTLSSLKKNLQQLHRQGKTIAFTNGCFDILHFGHISYLEKARAKDRILIVGVNSDASVRRIKGPRRPIVPQRERARVLAALACVDFVTIFDEDTPLKVIESLKPDILIKGADWKGKDVVGSDVVKSCGGRIELVRYLSKFSSTNIIEKIVKKCGA